MRNFEYTFETRKESFTRSLSIYMTVPLMKDTVGKTKLE